METIWIGKNYYVKSVKAIKVIKIIRKTDPIVTNISATLKTGNEKNENSIKSTTKP